MVGPAVHRAVTGSGNRGAGSQRYRAERWDPRVNVGAAPGRILGDR
jgi:hypothetical protein